MTMNVFFKAICGNQTRGRKIPKDLLVLMGNDENVIDMNVIEEA